MEIFHVCVAGSSFEYGIPQVFGPLRSGTSWPNGHSQMLEPRLDGLKPKYLATSDPAGGPALPVSIGIEFVNWGFELPSHETSLTVYFRGTNTFEWHWEGFLW